VMPSVMIVVLNWNGLSDTLDCLMSLQRLDYPDCKVVVVDNGSVDGSVEVVRTRFPGIMLVENEENLGYAGGNNVGLRYALAQGMDYVLLLNNDTEVAPDFVSRLVAAAEVDLAVGVVGPTIYYHDRPDDIWSAGGAIDWQRGRTWMVGLNERDVGQFGQESCEVDFVTGCALLVKRAVLEQVGLLDERFFAYYEDTEWCVRIARAGYRIVHVPEAKIWHKISPDAQADSPLIHYYMTRNRLLFLKVTGARAGAWLHTLVAEYLRTLISWSIRSKWHGKRRQRTLMVMAVRDFLAGRLGQVPLGGANGG
jgi:GT2 family glycosyltransferase